MKKLLTVIVFAQWILFGCFSPPIYVPKEAQLNQKPEKDDITSKQDWYRERSPMPTSLTKYEGSLWKDESSWGNLLRDHRARFKDDVVTITDLSSIINVPPPPVPKPVVNTAAGQKATKGKQAKAALNAALDTMGVPEGELEQNEILRALKSISARIVAVFPNGNMLVKGEKIDHRQQNTIRYITTVSGIVRPEDVSEKNEVLSSKLARSQVKTKRQIIARKVNLNALKPVMKKEDVGIMDRMGHLFSGSN